MTRNLKALGLALVAAFAMSAVAASAALATNTPLHLTTENYPVVLTGEQVEHPNGQKTHSFVTSAGTEVTCAVAKFKGTVTKEANTELTIIPTYENCRANPGNFKTTVTMTDCDYVFHGGTLEVAGGDTYKEGTADLVCPTGVTPDIEIWFEEAKHTAKAAPNCTLKPQPFVNKGENTYHNETGSTDSILVTTTVKEIAVVREGSILCGAVNQTATYTGSTTVKGFKDEKTSIPGAGTLNVEADATQVGITVSGEL